MGLWFDKYAPGELKRNRGRRELKEKAIHEIPAAYRRWAWKMCDFRPETCERCNQIAWQMFGLQHLWKNVPLPERASREEIHAYLWAGGVNVHDIYERHLVRERHVLALLPPAQEGVKRR